jgi:hypothetical protein
MVSDTFPETLPMQKTQTTKQLTNQPDLSDFLFSDTSLPVPDWDRAKEWVQLNADEI